MLGRQRARVAELALRERRARVRVGTAQQALREVAGGLLRDPSSLLVPFAAGVAGGAIALPRKSATRYRRSRERDPGDADIRRGAPPARDTIPWTSLLKTATTLWGLSEPLREALLAARAGERPPAEPAEPSGTHSGRVGSPKHPEPPERADPADRVKSSRQAGPPEQAEAPEHAEPPGHIVPSSRQASPPVPTDAIRQPTPPA